MTLDLPVVNLADRDGDGSSVDLRLAIGNDCDNGSLDDLGANSDFSSAASATAAAIVITAASTAATTSTRAATTTAGHYQDLDRLTLRSPVAVVQVEEVSGLALEPGGLSS
jgi:hypothetical protein